jgi:hypothetical protein
LFGRTIFRWTVYYRLRRINKQKIFLKKRQLEQLFGSDTVVPACSDDATHKIPIALQKKIIKMDMTEVLELLNAKTITSHALVKFLHNRSRTVGKTLEAITDSFYDIAMGNLI